MSENKQANKEVASGTVISNAIQIPGVKVDRNKFLSVCFASETESMDEILEKGPIEAGVTREKLQYMASKLVFKRTGESSIASFVAGIPGGMTMAATVPLDVLQFFGMSLRLAQELSYLYGADDLWNKGSVDMEKVQSQLILYFGVMFGVSGAVSGVRVVSTQLAKTALKKLPQKALTKTFWYPIVKQIGKALSIRVTKATVAKGVANAVPIVGGAISGSLNFASMMPMANRLQKTLDKAVFDYSEEEFAADLDVIENTALPTEASAPSLKEKLADGVKKSAAGIGSWVEQKKQQIMEKKEPKAIDCDEILDTIKKMKELLDAEAITQEEFEKTKDDLLSRL